MDRGIAVAVVDVLVAAGPAVEDPAVVVVAVETADRAAMGTGGHVVMVVLVAVVLVVDALAAVVAPVADALVVAEVVTVALVAMAPAVAAASQTEIAKLDLV